jgi:tetrahedral aminopeptidase
MAKARAAGQGEVDMEADAADLFDSDLLRELCLTPGLTGHEEPVQSSVSRRLAAIVEPTADVFGNVTARLGAESQPLFLACAHADQIGLTIKYIDEDGFLWVESAGYLESYLVESREFVIQTREGPVPAVSCKRPTVLHSEEENTKAPLLHEIHLDAGLAGKARAAAVIRVGDPVTLRPTYLEMPGGQIAATALDDRAGLYAVIRGLELYAAAPGGAAYMAASLVGEETGSFGARGLARREKPMCAITVDVHFASDVPNVDPRRAFGEVRLGEGPALARGECSNKVLLELAEEVARAESIPTQMMAVPRPSSTDADWLVTWPDTAGLVIILPTRYIHSPLEVVNRADLDNAARLLAALARRAGDVDSSDLFISVP